MIETFEERATANESAPPVIGAANQTAGTSLQEWMGKQEAKQAKFEADLMSKISALSPRRLAQIARR